MNDQEFREKVVASLARIEANGKADRKTLDRHTERLDGHDDDVTELKVQAAAAKRTGAGLGGATGLLALWENFKEHLPL